FLVGDNGRLEYFDFLAIRNVGNINNIKSSSSTIPVFDKNNSTTASFFQALINNETSLNTTSFDSSTYHAYKYQKINNEISNKMYAYFNKGIVFTPAEKNGKKVNCLLYISPKIISVKDHNVTMKNMFKGPFYKKKAK